MAAIATVFIYKVVHSTSVIDPDTYKFEIPRDFSIRHLKRLLAEWHAIDDVVIISNSQDVLLCGVLKINDDELCSSPEFLALINERGHTFTVSTVEYIRTFASYAYTMDALRPNLARYWVNRITEVVRQAQLAEAVRRDLERAAPRAMSRAPVAAEGDSDGHLDERGWEIMLDELTRRIHEWQEACAPEVRPLPLTSETRLKWCRDTTERIFGGRVFTFTYSTEQGGTRSIGGISMDAKVSTLLDYLVDREHLVRDTIYFRNNSGLKQKMIISPDDPAFVLSSGYSVHGKLHDSTEDPKHFGSVLPLGTSTRYTGKPFAEFVFHFSYGLHPLHVVRVSANTCIADVMVHLNNILVLAGKRFDIWWGDVPLSSLYRDGSESAEIIRLQEGVARVETEEPFDFYFWYEGTRHRVHISSADDISAATRRIQEELISAAEIVIRCGGFNKLSVDGKISAQLLRIRQNKYGDASVNKVVSVRSLF